MLKLFKHYTSKTSLLDDFMYYENRQKLLQQEKARLLIKSYDNPFILSRIEPVRKPFEPVRKPNGVLNLPINEVMKTEKVKDESNLEKVSVPVDQVLVDKEVNKGAEKANNTSMTTDDKVEEESGLLKIGSLSINPKKAGISAADSVGSNLPAPSPGVEAVNASKLLDIVTVGSMPVKVNGFAKSVGSLTVGTIPLDPGALKVNEASLSAKGGYRKG